MNRAMLVGRLTTKPELRYTSSNLPFARFSVAVNRTYSNAQGERETDFINVVVWRKQAENVCNFLNKGSLVSVEGRIQTGSYDDKDGNKRYTMDVALENFEFVESKNAREQSTNSGSYEPTPYDYQDSKSVNVEADPFAEFGDSVSILDDNFLE